MMNLVFLFVIQFLLKLRFPKNKSLNFSIKRRYGSQGLKLFRGVKNSCLKEEKCKLDLIFLKSCKTYNRMPKFLMFRLYRQDLQNCNMYKEWQKKLLTMEINFKENKLKKLTDTTKKWQNDFESTFSHIDSIYLNNLIRKNLTYMKNKFEAKQKKKLLSLGISENLSPLNPNQVLHNFSDRKLSEREKFILSFGLDCSLPVYKLNFYNYFCDFERLVQQLKSVCINMDSWSAGKEVLRTIAFKYYNNFNPYKIFHPLLNKKDINIMRNLGNDKNIIISKPDKGRGVVIMNKVDYIEKMNTVLNDRNKFMKIDIDPKAKTIKLEDKVNNTLKKIKLKNKEFFEHISVSGCTPGILYGLPKIHKENTPLRPILAAYNTHTYDLAKLLVPILSKISKNEFTVNNSYNFYEEISQLKISESSFMASFDVQSLFTNIPLLQTIDIIIEMLFPDDSTTILNLNQNDFRSLLELIAKNSCFLFNGQLYEQVDGVSMGNPIAPLFANIFMCYLERKIFELSDINFKPKFYRRYVDDTFAIFDSQDHANNFCTFINKLHPNIKFTMEIECNSKIPFLDVCITKNGNSLNTSIYRKPTYTKLGLSYFSFCAEQFKINTIKCLIYRAYHLSSSYLSFHKEIMYLQSFFHENGYPTNMFENTLKNFLNKIYRPDSVKLTAPKLKLYVKLPYFGEYSEKMKKELDLKLKIIFPYIDFKFIMINKNKTNMFFHFKDYFSSDMASNVIYKFKCTSCNAVYIGCTRRNFFKRCAEHRGVSHRTGKLVIHPPYSAIRDHCHELHGSNPSSNEFFILSRSRPADLLITESLYINKLKPSLNRMESSSPLYLF